MMRPDRSHRLGLTGARTLGSAALLALCILACASALAAAPALTAAPAHGILNWRAGDDS
jgi:Spy/CpxP family protein refolding chaperone